VKARAEHPLPGRVSDAEALWYDTRRWPAFVDGFGHVVRLEGDWPRAGARLIWDSVPNGRGRVIEEVVEHETRVGQTVAVEDGRLEGTQSVRFGDGVIVLELDFKLKGRTPLLTPFFVRRAFRDSLGRTLSRFARELRAEPGL
jgi:hypothetical protein